MDPLAAAILIRSAAPAYRSLGALTRSAKGIPKKAAVRSRTRRGSTIYPYLSRIEALNYYVSRGEVFPIDLAGREKQALFFQREPKVILGRRVRNDRLSVGYLEDRMAVGREHIVFTGRSLHIDAMYLLGLLGSRLYAYLYLENFSVTYDGEPKKIRLRDLRKLPIPIHRPVERGLIIGLVMRILNAKSASPNADTTELERGVDLLVYRLFGLSQEEAAHVDGGSARYRKLFADLAERGKLIQERIAGADPLPNAVGEEG